MRTLRYGTMEYYTQEVEAKLLTVALLKEAIAARQSLNQVNIHNIAIHAGVLEIAECAAEFAKKELDAALLKEQAKEESQ